MKRWGVLAVTLTCALAVAVGAQAKKKSDEGTKESSKQESRGASAGADKTYSNGDYKFELRYSGDWNANESKAEMGDVPAEFKGMMPRMLGVCFAGGKKCEPGDFGSDPEASLMVVDIAAAKRLAPKGKAEKVEKSEKASKGGKDECEQIERTNVKWGGRNAPWLTTRCPEKKKWRYTTTVTMQHANGKLQDAWTLQCSMRSKSKDRDESLVEYKDDLKPRCQKMVSTTKFRK